jgi:phage repressor protein C with HTH and peptisase S24 domain
LLLGLLLVTGCAATSDDLARDSGAQLQSMVVSVAETAATGDISAALAQLDALQVALDEARAQGEVSDERAATIQAALDLVRADLVALLPPLPDSEPTAPAEEQTPVELEPEDDRGNGGGGGGDGGNGNGNGGKGNSGGGNGNGGSRGNNDG